MANAEHRETSLSGLLLAWLQYFSWRAAQARKSRLDADRAAALAARSNNPPGA